jgi:peptidoglycan/xylan/chitin deacetylase (PgdA/CDA1 family)
MTYLLLHSISDAPAPACLSAPRFRFLCDRNQDCVITFDDGYADVFGALREAPPELSRRTIIFLVAGRIGRANDWDRSGPLAGKPLLSGEQIRALHQQGVRFGCHGLTHIDLAACEDDQLDRELQQSQRMLEDTLRAPVDGFSYPYGSFDRRVKDAVARCYRWAVAARPSMRSSDPYAIPRIGFAGDNPEWLFRLKADNLWLYGIKSHLTKQHTP